MKYQAEFAPGMREQFRAKCGCEVFGAIQMCKTHALASELAEALRELVSIYRTSGARREREALEWAHELLARLEPKP